MLWIVGILGFLIVLLTWVLAVPVIIHVETERHVYRIGQPGTLSFWLGPSFVPRMSLFGIAWSPSFAGRSSKDSSGTKEKKSRKGTRKISPATLTSLIRGIVNAVTFRRIAIDVDTDDVTLNARLVPVFLLASRGPVSLTTNFVGHVSATVLANINVYTIVWTLIKSFTKKQAVWK